jgi:hypothetical protein
MNAIGVLAILLAVFALLLVSWGSPSARGISPKQMVEPVFHRIFGSLSPAPRLEISSSYDYPAFDVTFRSKAEMENAEIQRAEFMRELNLLFKDYGPRERRFDAEMAVCFTYPGHIEEMTAAFRQKNEPNPSPQTTRAFDPHV